MDNRGIHFGAFAAFAILLAVSMLDMSCIVFNRPHRGTVPIETWTAENKAFKIRVTSYEEEDSNVTGTYYVFESTSTNATEWHEIMTFRHDERPEIPKDQIRFLNDKTAYVFMGWMYGVTIDGGSSWSIWDAQKDLPDWQCCNYGLIRDVSIISDGRGTMFLNPVPQRRGEVPELHTKDHGRHWTAQ